MNDRPKQQPGSPSAGSVEFDQLAVSKDLSQLVRSNAVHYWATIKTQIDLSGLTPYLKYEGMLAGDPHAGNFAPMPLRTPKGAREMRYVNVDFDDCGRGPFVLDFIRFVIASEATDIKIKRREEEKAYLKGLAGNELDPPKQLRDLLNMSLAEYDAMATEYLEKRASEHGFILTKGKIEAYTADIDRESIARLFPKTKVIDVGIRPLDRGGSASGLRIWVLIEGAGARRRIMELKQYEEPAISQYQPQPSPRQRLEEIRKFFWPNLDGSDYDLVKPSGARLFWLREKRVSLIDAPYSSTKRKKLAFLDELEIYDANQLGLAHGRQPQADAYHKALKASPEEFHSVTKTVEKAYLDIARAAFAER